MAGLDRLKTLDQVDVASRRVLVRVDFDVPLAPDGRVADDARIREALPTLRYLLTKGARVVVLSHLGRAGRGRRGVPSLEAPGLKLAELLGTDVVLADECVGDGARKVVQDLRDGRVAMLENLALHAEEDADDPAFARELALLGDIYVNEAFGLSGHTQASLVGLPRAMRERAAGLAFARELEALGRLVPTAERPFVAVIGGSRVGEKSALLDALVGRADGVLLGGVVANTFLSAQGRVIGVSAVESERLAFCRDYLERARARGTEVLLPVDVVAASQAQGASGETVAVDAVSGGHAALDIGAKTVALYRERLIRARAVLWSGALGRFERSGFAAGTLGVAQAIVEGAGFSVVAGADTLAAAQQSGLAARFSHLSSGGDATLGFIEGRKLPGVEALRP